MVFRPKGADHFGLNQRPDFRWFDYCVVVKEADFYRYLPLSS
jgi:hypothetical protein